MAKRKKAIEPTEVVVAEPKKSVMGRPRKELDTRALQAMASALMTVEQIADAFDCSIDHIYANYSEVLREGRRLRKVSLANSMWKNALEKDNVQMQIWLAKQHLGQKESQPESAQQINFNVIVNEVPK